MQDLLTALALVLVIEGVIYALFPEGMKRLMLAALEQPAAVLRWGGVAAAGLGIAVLWLLRG